MKLAPTIIVISLLAFSGAAFAQAPAAPAAPTMPAAPATPATPKVEKPRTAKSLDCSKQANAQKLHGKPRHAFMNTCKKS
jgi:Spy/CpxP family protein refolding chaperone